jgi:hypothetical protein
MESAHQTVDRLLGALESLTEEERHLLERGAFTEAIAIQERSRPLVDKIAELMLTPGLANSLDSGVQMRAQDMLSAQLGQIRKLDEQMEKTRQQLQVIHSAQSRAQRVRPIYRSPYATKNPTSFSREA